MRPSGKPVRAKRGFTLVEVMAAMTVLVLVLMSSISAITIGFRLLEDARLSTLASQVLQSEVENLRLKNWTQLSTLPASESFSVESSLGSTNFNRFTCNRTIQNVRLDAGGVVVMKEVVVSLSWASMDGRQHSRRYVTYLGKEGLNDYYYRSF